MANNGYKQATVAYKTDQDGNPLDINGQLTSVSGRRQAIAILENFNNPNPSKYEVEYIYSVGEQLYGEPTLTYDVITCPVGYLIVEPSTAILTPSENTKTLLLSSSNAWETVSVPQGFKLDLYSSGAGEYSINLSYEGSAQKQGEIIMRNKSTLKTTSVWVAYILNSDWVLATGEWNNFGIWYNNEIFI